jgi:dihydrofolate synthase/folylpolyglutamate synthase
VRPSVDECEARIEDVTDDGYFTVTFTTSETSEGRYEKVLLGLRGKHQIMNVALAIRLAESLRRRGFEIPKASIIKGIETADHPGRLELHAGQPSLLFDGAHNPSGAQALRQYLEQFVRGPLTLVFGAMNDKRLEEIAAILFPIADRLVLTSPDNLRAAPVDKLQDLAESILDHQKIVSTQSAAEALLRAQESTPLDGVICVTGSLYLIGQIKAMINAEALSRVAVKV